jgi:glycosyltransferase involved in cell wall biosynthesis
MKISVLTPSFNQGKYIEDNIKSILKQDYCYFEHIIFDNCSTDNTIEILKKYPHLKWVSEKDKGQTDALNKALIKAEGDIICWLNSDDLLLEDSFNEVVNFFKTNPDKSIVVGNIIFIDDEGNFLWRQNSKKIDYEGLLNGTQTVQQQSTFFRKEVFDLIGGFDESYHFCMDHEFFIRASKKYEFFSIDKDLAKFRRYRGTKTIDNELDFIKDYIRFKRKHNARIFSYGNLRLLYALIAYPFKKMTCLRKIIRKLKGKDPDFVLGKP